MRTWTWILLAGVALGFGAGCSDDEPTGTGGGLDPTLENAWPNENGRSWTYAVTERSWAGDVPDTVYADPDSVPAAPDIEEILSLLDDRDTPAPADTTLWAYGLQFSDSITTDPGVTAQHLAETMDPGAPAAGRLPVGRVEPRAAFFRSLARARPDLAPRIRALAGAAEVDIVGPLLVSGGAWEKTTEHIGLYGAVDTLLSWQFLDANVRPGHEFTFQLVPSLADDVFLHAHVVHQGTVTTPVGTFANGVEVAYLIDYGVSGITEGGSPEILGYARLITYGTVVYAPTVGPVRVYERGGITVGETLSEGVEDWELVLTEVRAGG